MRLLLPGAPERKKLDAIQAKIKSLADERKAIERAPPALEDMRDDELAAVRRFSDRHPFVGLDMRSSDRELPHASAERVAALLVACLGHEVVVDAIVAPRVAALKAGGKTHGLPRSERAAAIAKIDGELVGLYRTEELEVMRLEDAGHAIIRRADVDGRLIVALWYEQHVHDAAVMT